LLDIVGGDLAIRGHDREVEVHWGQQVDESLQLRRAAADGDGALGVAVGRSRPPAISPISVGRVSVGVVLPGRRDGGALVEGAVAQPSDAGGVAVGHHVGSAG
jgi:hypothetical protein